MSSEIKMMKVFRNSYAQVRLFKLHVFIFVFRLHNF